MKVILINGFEKAKKNEDNLTNNFIRDCKRFSRYLLKKVGLERKDIFYFNFEKGIKVNAFLRNLKNVVDLYPNESLIVYYSGHGEKDYWNLRKDSWNSHTNKYQGNKKYFLKFPRLLRIFQKRSLPLIIISDCCYGMSLGKKLKKLSYPWLLLGLAPETRVGYGSVQSQITKNWSKHCRANPKYDNGNKKVRYIKIKSYNKNLYGFRYGDGKHFRKFFFSFRYKRIRVVLRAGSDIDHLCYPKK